ncbi:GtrA family protein [Streptomyces sp. NBC_00212]|uniref:GtrA family protein n=1 Tax=Streptomyces sp. NBC_00212 TaxID=2975684 RepID=UPI002F909204
MVTSETHQLSAVPGPFAAFARFALYDGGIGVAASAAVALVALLMPWAVANALVTAASTLLATEVNARFTFGARRSADWRQHLQSAGSAVAAYVVTCAAMAVLHLAAASPGVLGEAIVYLLASGLAGIGRFVVLRMFVFAAGPGPERVRPGNVASDDQAATTPVLYTAHEGEERMRVARRLVAHATSSPRTAHCRYRPHHSVRPASWSVRGGGMRFVGLVGGPSAPGVGAARPGRERSGRADR